MSECPCPGLSGPPSAEGSLAVTVGGMNIYEFCRPFGEDALAFVDGLTLTEQQVLIAGPHPEGNPPRLGFLRSPWACGT